MGIPGARAFAACYQLEEAHLALRHVFHIPLAGLPSPLYVELRRRIREACRTLEELGVPGEPISRCRAALDAFVSRKQFPRLQQSSDPFAEGHAASRQFDVALGKIGGELGEVDVAAHFSGWAHARLGLYARMWSRAAGAIPGGTPGVWEDVALSGLRDVFNTITVRVPLRRTATFPADAKKLIRLELVYQVIDDLGRNGPSPDFFARLLERIDVALEPLQLEPLSEWVFEALEHQSGVRPLWQPTPADLARSDAVLGPVSIHESTYQRTGDPDELDRAIALLESAVASSKGEPVHFSFLDQLAGRLWERSQVTGSRADQDRSIAFVRQSLRLLPIQLPVDGVLSNLGLSLTARFEHTEDPDDLAAAIDAFEEATSGLDTPEGRQLIWWNNLANALRLRFHYVSHEVADLDEAIRRMKLVVEHTPAGHPDEGIHKNNLANMLRERLVFVSESNAPEQLDEAIDLLQQALSSEWTAPIDRPAALASLAGAFAQRYAALEREEDLEAEIEHYRVCIREGEDLRANIALRAAMHWCDRAFERGDWAQAAEAFEAAMRCSRKVLASQVGRAHRESALGWSQGLATRGAYALLQLGEVERAVVALESGLARLLSIELDTTRRDLERLRELGHADLYDRYVAAAEAVSRESAKLDRPRAGSSDGGNVSWSKLPGLQKELDDAIDEIRRVEGFESFLADLAFEEIAAATGDPLIYVFATTRAGAAMIVADGAARHVALPELTVANERDLVTRHLEAISTFVRSGLTAADRDDWAAALERVLADVTCYLLEPLADLPESGRLAWVPVGALQLLPVHAARLPGDGDARLLDRTPCYYAPNARALAADDVDERSGLTLVKVGGADGLAPLPHSDLERDLIRSCFDSIELFEDERATRAAVLAQLGATRLTHFSCHGRGRLDRPLESSLYLHDAEPLTVADLSRLTRSAGTLVSLSACETGIAGMQLPEEVIGMPTVLLGAGSRHVLSTLWVVEDRAAAYFFGRFYHLWIKGGVPPLEAFTRTQRWLREATNSELAAFLNELGPWDERSPATRELAALESVSPHEAPFAGPTTWAPFVWTGLAESGWRATG